MINERRLAVVVVIWLVLAVACQPDKESSAETAGRDSRSSATGEVGDAGAELSLDLPTIDRECPPAGENATREIEEQAGALIPLVTGLTLVNTWMPAKDDPEQYEHECLTQVSAVTRDRVVLSYSCPAGPTGSDVVRGSQQICRADMRDARFYRSSVGPAIPELQSNTTSKLLSRRTFHELKQAGSTSLRFVEMRYAGDAAPGGVTRPRVVRDWVGRLQRTDRKTLPMLVNDRTVDFPVLLAAGDMRVTQHHPTPDERPGQIRLAVLDDERLPLVVEVTVTGTGATGRYTRITYPSRTSLERDLNRARRTVVQGIYFAHNSAELREESKPVLREIADVLNAHSDWRLRIEGHTDNVGGAPANQALSVRRAEAVRQALVQSYGIESARLTTTGYGSSAPKDTNDSPEGRARNRRVELVRQ